MCMIQPTTTDTSNGRTQHCTTSLSSTYKNRPVTNTSWPNRLYRVHLRLNKLLYCMADGMLDERTGLLQGRNHGWEVQFDVAKVCVPTSGRLRSATRPQTRLGIAAGGGRPSRCGDTGWTPEIFIENKMLNPAFWWLLRSLVDSGLPRTSISEQTTNMSRAKSVSKFQLFCRGCAPGC